MDRLETIDAIYSRRTESRGPFYMALAETTKILRTQQYRALTAKVRVERSGGYHHSTVAELENCLAKMQEL